jgi:hypothetical protein
MKLAHRIPVLLLMSIAPLSSHCASGVQPLLDSGAIGADHVLDAAAIDSGTIDVPVPIDAQTTMDAIGELSASDTATVDIIVEASATDSSADDVAPDVPPGTPVNHRATNPPCSTTGMCMRDSDCGSGHVCACAGTAYASLMNTCVTSNCVIDADCGSGGWCSPSETEGGACAWLAGYFCHTPSDTCINDSECVGSPGPAHCIYDTGAWHCGHLFCD